jgi:hypothetical protein
MPPSGSCAARCAGAGDRRTILPLTGAPDQSAVPPAGNVPVRRQRQRRHPYLNVDLICVLEWERRLRTCLAGAVLRLVPGPAEFPGFVVVRDHGRACGLWVLRRTRRGDAAGLRSGRRCRVVAAVCLTWADQPGARRHVPDFFARLADGSAELIDVRPDELVGADDAEVFAATHRACAAVGWGYRRVGVVDAVLAALSALPGLVGGAVTASPVLAGPRGGGWQVTWIRR